MAGCLNFMEHFRKWGGAQRRSEQESTPPKADSKCIAKDTHNDFVRSLCSETLPESETEEVASLVLEHACLFLDYFEDIGRNRKGPKARYEKSSCLLARLYKRCGVHHSLIVTTMVYLQRLHDAGVVLSSSKINAYLLVAMMNAAKFLEDGCPPNSFWAEVGFLSLEDTNAYELRFLTAMRFRLCVSPEEFAGMAGDMLAFRASADRCTTQLASRFVHWLVPLRSSHPGSPISRAESCDSLCRSPMRVSSFVSDASFYSSRSTMAAGDDTATQVGVLRSSSCASFSQPRAPSRQPKRLSSAVI